MKGISLFSSAGIGELLFNELDIEIVLANELLEKNKIAFTQSRKKSIM